MNNPGANQRKYYNMTKAIDSTKYDVLRYVPYGLEETTRKVLETKVNALFEELGALNEYNFEAHLPIREVDMGARQTNWGTLSYGEDYETSETVNYQDPFTGYGESCSVTQREETIEKCDDEIERLDGLKRMSKKQKEEYKKWEELKDNLERADTEIDELMWNTCWAPYGDSVDKALAERIPQLTWVTDLREDHTYLTLSCIGQDNGPALMAYVILSHQVVPRQFAKYWTSSSEREWTQYVIGKTCFMECAKVLGVEDLLKYHLEKDQQARDTDKRLAEERERKHEEVRNTPATPAFLKLLKKLVKEHGKDVVYTSLILDVPEEHRKEYATYANSFTPKFPFVGEVLKELLKLKPANTKKAK